MEDERQIRRYYRTRAQSAKLVFLENFSNGGQNTDEKVYYPPSKAPLIFDRPRTNTRISGHGRTASVVELQENPLNWRRDGADKVFCLESNVLCIIDRSWRNLHAVVGKGTEWEIRSFRKIHRIGDKIQQWRYFITLVKCSLLLTFIMNVSEPNVHNL